MGWIINWKKSNLSPSRTQRFLGLTLNSELGKCSLPEEKIEIILTSITDIKRKSEISVRRAMALIGLFTASIPAVAWAQIHTRPLQLQTLNQWDHSKEGLDENFSLSTNTLDSLRWWENLEIGKTWRRRNICVLPTDASPSGWRAHVKRKFFQGSWKKDHIQSSNYRQYWKGPGQPCQQLKGHHVQILSDNMTTIAYINRQGGTRSDSLMSLTYALFSLAESFFLSLSALHIKGTDNTAADYLSRHVLRSTDWALNHQVFKDITRLWGTPEIDLFATRSNRQVREFCSLDPQGGPMAIDALSIKWDWNLAYAFPPIPMIPKVLAKIREDQARVILVAPFWPKRAWFSLLRSMSITDPWVLPDQEDLLVQGAVSHPQDKGLHLTALAFRGRS